MAKLRAGLFLLCAVLLAAQTPQKAASSRPSALDKKQFEFYLRHYFVWPPPIEIHIADPKPSPIPGFFQVDVRAVQGAASDEERFFISKDGRQIIRGSVSEISRNPFQEQLSKLKTKGHPSFGTPGAPVVIAEFSDFQCHYCKEEAKIFRENLLKEYPSQVHFYFMDFPLEGIHPWARAAAIAGRCVLREGELAFWDFHDWIFEHQEQMTPENLKTQILDWAKGKSLDTGRIGTCMDTRATEPEVNASIAMGHALDVNSTPTAFINGRPKAGATPWPDLKSVIDFEIGYQQTVRNAGENCGCDLTLPKPGVK